MEPPAYDMPLHVVRTVAPEIDITAPARKQFAVLESSPSITFTTTQISGSINNSTLTFQTNPNNNETFFNRRPKLRLKGNITFTGQSAAAGVRLIQAAGMRTTVVPNPPLHPQPGSGTRYLDAPRAWPIANATTTVQATLQGDNINASLNRYARWLTRYSTGIDFQQTTSSPTPTMLDQSLEYSSLDGTLRNPMLDYAHTMIQDARGAFEGCVITRNDDSGAPGDVAIVNFDFTECVQLSPFLYEQGEYSTGLIGLQNITFQFTMNGIGSGPNSGLAAAIWSHMSGAGGGNSIITSSVVNFTEATMLVSNLNPSEQIPLTNYWPWNEIHPYPQTTQAALASGASLKIPQNTISLDCIPQRVYIVVNPDSTGYNISTTDTPQFFISNIEVFFANNSVTLSDASDRDLYDISVRNGCSLSWTQWRRTIGSVLCLEFGRDIALGNPLYAPGLALKANFRVNVTVENLSSQPQTPELNIFMVYGGLVRSEQGRISHSYGYLSESDVIVSKSLPQVGIQHVKSVYGSGGFWQDLGNFGRNLGEKLSRFAKNVGRPVLDIARKVVPQFYPPAGPALEGVSNVAQSLGYGAMVGGKRLSKAELRKLARLR